MRVVLFMSVFMFSLSCLFSLEDKLFDMDEVFMVRKRAIMVYLTGSVFSLVIAILYDKLIY